MTIKLRHFRICIFGAPEVAHGIHPRIFLILTLKAHIIRTTVSLTQIVLYVAESTEN